jgi:glycosyltransferase involved in cell wall biosynthesis
MKNNIEKFNTIFSIPNAIIEGGTRLKNNNNFNQPTLSIITVILNGEKYLEESFKSLHQQKNLNYEHIVIDGGSSDDTIKIIKKNENKIDYWCQINDRGIYDAFNFGMMLSRGKYLGFLNSDDIYSEKAFYYLKSYIENYPEKDFIFGAVKKHWGVLYGYKPFKIYWSWGFYSSHSTGFFIKLSAAKRVGLYNLKYKFSSDYDYFFRMIIKEKLKGIGTKKNELFGIFRRGGFSSRIKFIDHFFEEIKIRIDNGQNKILILLIFIFKYLKHLTKIN